MQLILSMNPGVLIKEVTVIIPILEMGETEAQKRDVTFPTSRSKTVAEPRFPESQSSAVH